MVATDELRRKAHRWRDDEELTRWGLVPVIVQDTNVEAQGRSAERGGNRRLDHRPRHVSPTDLGPPDVFDHRRRHRVHQPSIVGGIRGFSRRGQDPHSTQIDSRKVTPCPPGCNERWHHAENGHLRILHELEEAATGRGVVEEGHRGPRNHRGEDQPGSHHPAEVGRPSDDIVLMDVLVQEAVRRRLDRRGVHPGNHLGRAGRAGGEQDVQMIVRRSHRCGEGSIRSEESVPALILGSKSDDATGFDHDAPGGACFAELLIHRQLPPGPEHSILGHGRDRFGQAQPGGDLVGSKRIGDRNDDTPGQHNTQIGDHRLDGHRHRDGDPIARSEIGRDEPVGESIHRGPQLAVGHTVELPGPCIDDRDRVLGRGETRLDDVHAGAGQPIGPLRIGAGEDGIRLAFEADAEPVHHGSPEAGSIIDRPAVEIRVGVDAAVSHQGGQVGARNRDVVRGPSCLRHRHRILRWRG